MKKIFRLLIGLWKKFAHWLAVVNTTILLTLVYFLLIGPMALIAFILRKDLMGHKVGNEESFWKPKDAIPNTLEQTRHQF